MADTKTTALTADASPTTDDIVMTVNDPTGAAVNRKVTLGAFPISTATQSALDAKSGVSSGAGAPASTPTRVGYIYVDTTGDRAYIATDTASSADWDLIPITAAQILALLVTVDGTGSGLDADTLDGVDSTAFVRDTGDETIAGIKTFSSDPLIPDEAYGSGWNGVLEPPTKNAVYDQMELKATAANYLPLVAAGASVENIGAVESNVNTIAATGATETLDTSVYGVHDCTMDQACTFTFSNPAPSGKATIFTLILRGAFTPTFPAAVDWGDASAPTYTTPSQYVFTTVDAGTTWLGQQVAKAFG